MHKTPKGMWEFFISHHRFTYIIIFAAILLGVVSIFQMPKESNPEVNIPIGVVSIPFPGASAEEVEELVTDIVESKILTLNDVEKVTSTSREGFSSIVVEFDAKAETSEKIDELKERVDEAERDLPSDVEDAFVQQVRFSDEPIYTFSLSGPYSVTQLKRFAEDLEGDIERVANVSKVEITGGREREIQVVVDKTKLDAVGLSIGQVTGAIRRANANIPTGSIETAGARYSVRLSGRVLSAGDVRRIPVFAKGDVVILVEDVAEVIDGLSVESTISRLSVGGSEPLPSITMAVFKTEGGDIIKIVDEANIIMDQARVDYLPENIVIESIEDQAELIQKDLTELTSNGVGTIILVFVLLFIFLGFREASLASFAIPLSFLITFIFLLAIGSTINFLTLFSLILALGILIDSAIVVTEGMHRYVRRGLEPLDAACRTVNDFKLPLISGTLTTVFAFVPMLLMSGILGEFVKHIPITVTIVLLSSLFVALGLVTTLGVYWLKNGKHEEEKKQKWFDRDEWFAHITSSYDQILAGFLNSRRRQKWFMRTLILMFVLGMSLPATGVLQVNMFPSEDFDFFFINVRMPIGTPLEVTSKATEEVEALLVRDERIQSFATNVGRSRSQDGGGSGSHLASILINLSDDREDTSLVIVDEYQRLFNKEIDHEVSVSGIQGGPPSGAPVEIVLKGKNLETLENLARQFESIVKEVPGTVDVQTTIQETSGEFLLTVDRAKAELYGISTIELASVLRNAVSGTDATIIRTSGDEIDVSVKYALDPSTYRDGRNNIVDIGTIESLTIATPRGDIPLSAFTKTELSGTRPSIQHDDGKRVIRVTSQVQTGVAAAEVFGEVSSRMSGITIPPGYEVLMGGEREDIQESYNDMFRAMILAVFLIASALVLQFASYRQPLFILVTIPLALIGVFFGLVLVGQPLSFPGIIGIVALTGIVVNNAIILIDRINRNRHESGMDVHEAVREASRSRLQPIVLTTITTVIGILPITLSSELWGPLGFSIIFGLSFSTITTLFVVPHLYAKYARR